MRNFSARGKNAKAVNRSFSPRVMSNQISCATLAMAMSRNFSPEGRGWHSTRPVHFYEEDSFKSLQTLNANFVRPNFVAGTRTMTQIDLGEVSRLRTPYQLQAYTSGAM